MSLLLGITDINNDRQRKKRNNRERVNDSEIGVSGKRKKIDKFLE